MSARTAVIPGNRRLVLGSLRTSVDYTLDRPFVALLALGTKKKIRDKCIACGLWHA